MAEQNYYQGPLVPLSEGLEELRLYGEVGYFICHYASVERVIHILFHRFCGLKEDIARTMIGGMPLGNVVNLLNRMIETSDIDQSRKDTYNDCIHQLNHITTFRHALIHRGAHTTPTAITSTNAATAKSPAAVEVWKFSFLDIRAAGEDSHRMAIKLLSVWVPEMKQVMQIPNFQEWLGKPWRYKPVQPEKPYQQRRNIPQ